MGDHATAVVLFLYQVRLDVLYHGRVFTDKTWGIWKHLFVNNTEIESVVLMIYKSLHIIKYFDIFKLYPENSLLLKIDILIILPLSNG